MVHREDGFTLIELLVVLVIMAILLATAIGFQVGARERAADATAKANIRIALPAIEAYRTDNDAYAGMTQAGLASQYGAGFQGFVVVSASASSYCVSASSGGRAWYKAGPSGPVTTTACS
jgi:prepilin-type N-terminal cleavage/methylation domain